MLATSTWRHSLTVGISSDFKLKAIFKASYGMAYNILSQDFDERKQREVQSSRICGCSCEEKRCGEDGK